MSESIQIAIIFAGLAAFINCIFQLIMLKNIAKTNPNTPPHWRQRALPLDESGNTDLHLRGKGV